MLNWGSHVVEEEYQRVACGIAPKEGNLFANSRKGIEQDCHGCVGRCIGAIAGDLPQKHETVPCPCTVTITKIYDIQGSGEKSPLVGKAVTVEAIVVGDFENPDGFGPWRLAFSGNADWDESKSEHGIWKTGYGVHRCLAIVDQSAPGGSEAEAGCGQEKVFSCRGHVLVEPLVPFLLSEGDDHRVGVDAESCVGMRAADSGDLCLIGDDKKLPWSGIVC